MESPILHHVCLCSALGWHHLMFDEGTALARYVGLCRVTNLNIIRCLTHLMYPQSMQ